MKKGKALAAATMLMAAPLVAFWEGRENTAYLDPVGIPTVCYGHTLTAEMGDVYTDKECYHLLKADLRVAADAVDRRVDVPLSPETKAALISFVFNVGETQFASSTLLRKLKAGDYAGACNELPRWVYAKGKKLRGLVRRRQAERELCLSGL
ncbi:MAG: lysozyme [Rickettsiales bacterium]|nr:lysozyme [Rickettsiales bacterium]